MQATYTITASGLETNGIYEIWYWFDNEDPIKSPYSGSATGVISFNVVRTATAGTHRLTTVLKKQIEGSYLPQTIAGAYNEATWYQLLQLYAKNNFNAGSLYIDGGSPKTSGYPFQKYVGQTTALGAIDQQNGSDYYIWNTSGTPQSVSNWKKQIGIADPQKIQGATPRNYNYTVAGGDNNATLIADMKKRYTVDHNEQVETENIAQAQQIFVVEQNNGSITAPATKTIGSDTYNFIGWTDGDMNLTKTISSPTSNLAYTAQYHGKLRTGRPDLADTKNQRRLVTYGGASGNWGMVYESMGNIYLSFSGNGGIDWYNNETRLNTTLGTASNPTVSNLLMYNGTRPCILIAWVETVGGASTLHLQTLQMYGGNYWGWGFNADAGQDASNHRTLNQIELGSTGGTSVWNLRNDARPVVQLTQVGNAIRTYLAYEGTDDKLHAAFMTTPTADDDLEGSYLDRVGFDPYVRIASAYSAHYPAIITYPSSYGFPAKTYVYFLSGGYAAGRRIAAYDFDTKTESVLSNPNNDYTYSSLQGSVNPSNNTYGLVAEALGNDMTTLKVNYYFKPTYMGSSVPSLSTVFSSMKQPSLMFDQTSGFGSSSSAGTPVMKSTGNNSFYQYVSSSLSEIGPNIGGIFSQERVASGDRTAMVAKTVTTPATLVRYSGSGLAKSSGSSPINIQAVRLWNDDEGKEEKAVLDFSDADVDLLDSLEGGNVICAVKVNQPANSVIRQNESNTALAVSLYRNGNIVRSYSASVWRNLSLTSLPAVQEGDVITFSLSRKNKKSGFNIVELKDKSFEKKITGGDILIPTQIAVGAYPNPFNPSTTFRVSLPQATNVRLAVYNMLGQKVAALVDGMVQAGYNDYRFDGSSLSSGIYLYRMEIAKESEREIKSGKIMLVK